MLTVIAMDHITLRWEEPIAHPIAMAMAEVANESLEQAAPEIDKSIQDLILFGVCAYEKTASRIRHVPYQEFIDRTS